MKGALIFSATLALLGLGACSDQNVQDNAVAILTGEPNPPKPRYAPRFAPLLAAGPERGLDVSIADTSLRGGFLLESKQGNIETWLGTDGTALIFDRGVLHGTRGLDAGVLASDVSETAALIRRGATGSTQRAHTFLDGTDRAVTLNFDCTITLKGRPVIQLDRGEVQTNLLSETCHGTDQTFQNQYWVLPGSGEVVQSQQWMGDRLGALLTLSITKF